MLKPENRQLFAKIINRAHAVLVCRSSPKQKAEIIEFAKSINPKMVSLAIGDGGNDVSMIKTADVGIGIFGKEGYQAVSSSDYAIAEFQFLRRLIFIHGRYSVRRITIFITQFLVKNVIFSIPFLLFAFDSAYSGQTFFEPGYVMVFNAFASQLAIWYFGVYDQDIDCTLKSKQTKLLLPYLYTETRDKTAFNLRDFFLWYFYGIYSGIAIYYFSFYSYMYAIDSDGQTFGLWQFSFAPYISIWVVNLAIVSLYIQAWSWATFVFYSIHIVLFYPGWMYIYNEWPQSNVYKSQFDFYSYGLFWLVVLFWWVLIIMPIYFIKQGKAIFYPNLVNLVIGNKIKNIDDIEEKLKIDIVKLEQDLESDSDESVKMATDLADQKPRLSSNNLKTLNWSSNNYEKTKLPIRTVNSENINENSIDSKENLSNRNSLNSRKTNEEFHSNTENSLNINSRSLRSNLTLTNARKSTWKSPSFEKFTDSIKEYKIYNQDRSLDPINQKLMKYKKKKQTSNK